MSVACTLSVRVPSETTEDEILAHYGQFGVVVHIHKETRPNYSKYYIVYENLEQYHAAKSARSPMFHNERAKIHPISHLCRIHGAGLKDLSVPQIRAMYNSYGNILTCNINEDAVYIGFEKQSEAKMAIDATNQKKPIANCKASKYKSPLPFEIPHTWYGTLTLGEKGTLGNCCDVTKQDSSNKSAANSRSMRRCAKPENRNVCFNVH